MQLEGELKRICSNVLAGVKSSDDDTIDPSPYVVDRIQDEKPRKHDKHASFLVTAPKPYVPTNAATSFQRTASVDRSTSASSRATRKIKPADEDMKALETLKDMKVESGVVFEPLAPANARASKPKASFNNPDDQALSEIRNKLDVRPKTSAAACIDYAASESAPSSIPSNRTTYTPCTSVGVTPGATSKRFSQAGIEVEAISPIIPLPEPEEAFDMDPESKAQARAWIAEKLEERRQILPQTVQQEEKPAPGFHLARQPEGTESRPITRTGSIKNSIREYIRPKSSAGSIRSVQSVHSTASHGSELRGRWNSIKRKVSNASLRSRSSSSKRPGYDEGEEYFIDPEHPDLNRPLPALPGLDTFHEKIPHIASLMKPVLPRRDPGNVVIDENGLERSLTRAEEQERQEALARAVLEKMSGGSIGGSVPTSPISMTAPRMSFPEEVYRHVTDGSANYFPTRQHQTPAVTEEPGSRKGSTTAKIESSKGWKRLGKKLGLGRKSKTKVVAMV